MTSRRFRVELVRDAQKDLKRLKPWTGQVTRELLRTVLNDELICIVLIVGPHENIYLKAERRFRAWLKREIGNE